MMGGEPARTSCDALTGQYSWTIEGFPRLEGQRLGGSYCHVAKFLVEVCQEWVGSHHAVEISPCRDNAQDLESHTKDIACRDSQQFSHRGDSGLIPTLSELLERYEDITSTH